MPVMTFPLSRKWKQAGLDCQIGNHDDAGHYGDGTQDEPEASTTGLAMAFHKINVGEHLDLHAGNPHPASEETPEFGRYEGENGALICFCRGIIPREVCRMSAFRP
jgi:hypothetical protein